MSSIPLLMSIFPDDCLLEILSRLPPCSLMRFRSVSKSWCAFIDSPEFIRIHLHRSTIDSTKKYPQSQFVFKMTACPDDGFPENWQILAMRTDEHLDIDVRELAPPALHPHPAPQITRGGGDCGLGVVEGSCNGLICVRYRETGEIILWNPWIRKSFVLPEIKYPSFVPGKKYSEGGSRGHSRCGFGYNDLTDEYKVVRFVTHAKYTRESGHSHYFEEVYVYGTKCNSWRKLPKDFPYYIEHLNYRSTSGVLANGALHWSVWGRDAYSIAAIDLKTDKYSLLSLPEALQSMLIRWHTTFFGVVDGYLCIIPPLSHSDQDRIPSGYEISIWLMKDYGVKDSWTKFAVLLPGNQPRVALILQPLGFSEEGNMLSALHRYGKFIVQYDIKNQILVKKVQIAPDWKKDGYPSRPFIDRAHKWVPSIVPVPHSSGKKGVKG